MKHISYATSTLVVVGFLYVGYEAFSHITAAEIEFLSLITVATLMCSTCALFVLKLYAMFLIDTSGEKKRITRRKQ